MFTKLLSIFNTSTNETKPTIKQNNDIVDHQIKPINNASWQPETEKNNNLLQSEKIKTNWEYRRYLTNNAPQIMEFNYLDTANSVSYTKRPNEIPSIQSNNFTPFKSITKLPNSDLKQSYINQYDIATRKMATEVVVKHS
jgi:hypothetical protein|tara:strand:+ start:311 stop:730 length:420 start_codon:yes stop_codon:yes gene_type:complete